jgi:hypothetical protein
MSVVYFIQAETGGPIKIGFAETLKRRLRTLQCATPDRLKVLASVDAPATAERTLHRLLRRWRLRGEWFKDEPPVKTVAAKVATLVDSRDLIPVVEGYLTRLADAENFVSYLDRIADLRSAVTSPYSARSTVQAAKAELGRIQAGLDAQPLTLRERLAFSVYLEDATLPEDWIEANRATLQEGRDAFQALLDRLGPKEERA